MDIRKMLGEAKLTRVYFKRITFVKEDGTEVTLDNPMVFRVFSNGKPVYQVVGNE